ncbi:MAG: IS5 family transposase [Patescibacteria group bacterium]
MMNKIKTALMQKQSPAKTNKMLLMSETEFFDKIIETGHPFRKVSKLIDFNVLAEPLRGFYSSLGRTGVDVEKGLKCLIVQFWENLSDREMEYAVKGTMAVRWFCGFNLTEETPDHTYFCKLRKRLGTKRIANIFKALNKTLEGYGMFGNVFKFIDASAIVTKKALWKERDKAIADGEEKLNNLNVEKYAADKQARWGAKSKNNIWFGYKRHASVDMRYGLIEKLAVTPANVIDYRATKSICPRQGMVFADKLYDCKEADKWIKANNCQTATIRKRNNKQKNRDLDRWRSGVRMPFEGVFSKLNKRARYRGKAKVAMQCFLEAICHNLKKAVKILPQNPVPIIIKS